MFTKETNPQELLKSRAIARCILTGTSTLVVTFLIWKTVTVLMIEPPQNFIPICLLVGIISILCPSLAIYRIMHPFPQKNRTRLNPLSSSPSLSRISSASPGLLLAIPVQDENSSWYLRN